MMRSTRAARSAREFRAQFSVWANDEEHTGGTGRDGRWKRTVQLSRMGTCSSGQRSAKVTCFTLVAERMSLFGFNIFSAPSLAALPLPPTPGTLLPSRAWSNEYVVVIILARKLAVKASHTVLSRVALVSQQPTTRVSVSTHRREAKTSECRA